MCERCQGISLPILRRDRRKLWEIPHSYHCAIVGTCFSPEDMAWLRRKLKLTLAPDAREYDVHRYFVEQAAQSGPASRLMHKRLDEKFSGEVRRFARETGEDGWRGLWDQALAAGSVAAAFWALVSHGCVSDDLKLRAYADVHMLSHLMGGENRRSLRENQDLGRRCAELEGRLARTERSAAERLAEKDARIRELEMELSQRRAAVPLRAQRSASGPRSGRLLREVNALRRRVAVERLRARTAEAELDRLRRLLDDAPRMQRQAGTESEPATAPRDLGGQAILYVGGRPSLLPFLRAAVESRNGCLLHHDGGFEQATRCLEGLVERADVVVCPVDCVSHDACLRVKGLCRRLDKRFLPVRSAGATTFTRVLGVLGRTGDATPLAPAG
ncbi:DUF2325 domain-containing protein [Azospirillum sp.]|uniref:DUF2325 domain-containing protein n=1 Tax=Azospirillum sp. TaxID=34012 RepID=UPI003D742E7C